MKLVTASQMKFIDEKATKEFHIPAIVLMENAANELCQAICGIEGYQAKRFLVIAGPGNNGGDGFAAARKLLNKNLAVKTIMLSKPEELKGDSKTNYDILKSIGADIRTVTDVTAIKRELGDCDVVVDALFGTGLQRPLDGLYKAAVELVNNSGRFVVSVDIPSGLDSDTGKPKGAAVVANITVTFAYEKLGHVLYPGRGLCGHVITADIGIPAFISDLAGIHHFVVRESDIRRLVRHLARNDYSHKGSYGHLAVIAGSTGKTGAAVMSSIAALRIGAGLVTAAVPKSLNQVFETNMTEVMTEPVSDIDGFFCEDAYDKIMTLIEGKIAVVIGPGISTRPETVKLVRRLVRGITNIPVILDADALNIIAKDISIIDEAKTELILTPHPGEMARLTGKSVAKVLADKVAISREFATKHSVSLVLKGADTIIATKDGKIHVNTTGNAALATAGSGDVLTGMVGGLLAQGLSPLRACVIGVYIHGAVADDIAGKYGKVGIVATDLPGIIPSVLFKYFS